MFEMLPSYFLIGSVLLILALLAIWFVLVFILGCMQAAAAILNFAFLASGFVISFITRCLQALTAILDFVSTQLPGDNSRSI